MGEQINPPIVRMSKTWICITPNYLDYIYPDALDEVKSGAVTIIR